MLAIFSIILLFVGVTTAHYAKEIRQCKCDEQTKCFGEIKEVGQKCFDESTKNTKNELNYLLAELEPEKLTQCFGKFDEYLAKLIDCFNGKLAKEKSCADYKGDEKVKTDFREILIKQLRKQSDPRMKHLYGLEENPSWFRQWHYYGKNCSFSKIVDMDCFADCGLNVEEQKVEKAIESCYKEVDVLEVHHKECECLRDNGIGQLKDYCTKVANEHKKQPHYNRALQY